MFRTLLLVFLVTGCLSCFTPTDVHSSFDLDRNELLNRMRKIERIYFWNNFKVAIKHPALILEDVFEGLPDEWRKLKRFIRRNQFEDAYRIIENDSVDIAWSLRYTVARCGFYEIARSFYQHFEDPEEAGWRNHILGREQWFMWEYPFFELMYKMEK